MPQANETAGPTPKQRFFIFAKCQPGKVESVGLELARKKKDIVRDVSSVSGEWDLLFLVEIAGGVDVGREIAGFLTDISGIVRTNTVAAYRLSTEH